MSGENSPRNGNAVGRVRDKRPVLYDGMRVRVFDEENHLLFRAVVKSATSSLITLEQPSERVRFATASSSSTREQPSLLYDGMRVEVLDKTETLLFEAVVKTINPTLITLERASELLNTDLADEQPVSIRGFHAKQNFGVHMEGRLIRLSRGQDRTWMVTDLSVTGTDNGRTFSRTQISAKGWIQPEDTPDAAWTACTVTDASSGGVRFQSGLRLEQGQRFLIHFKLRRGKDQPPLLCTVRRIIPKDAEYEYGCEFADITPAVNDIIVKTLIELYIMR